MSPLLYGSLLIRHDGKLSFHKLPHCLLWLLLAREIDVKEKRNKNQTTKWYIAALFQNQRLLLGSDCLKQLPCHAGDNPDVYTGVYISIIWHLLAKKLRTWHQMRFYSVHKLAPMSINVLSGIVRWTGRSLQTTRYIQSHSFYAPERTFFSA